MSLLGSLATSVNGLLAQSYALSNASNNIANSSTTGYKATTTSFEDIVSSCATEDSSGTSGASAQTTYQNDSQGTIESASTSTYLAINGNGYFAVETANGSGPYYTRDGDFTLNADGYLENSEGYILLGKEAADPTTMTAINVPSTLTVAAVATSTLDYTANLNANATTGTSSSANDVTTYDSLGTAETVSYTWKNTGDNTWSLTVASPGGAYDNTTDTTGDFSTSIAVTFDSSGAISNIDNTGTGYTVVGNTISFSLTYPNSATQTISCDLSNVTQYASTSSSATTADVSSFTQNGAAAGAYDGISIDTSGNVAVNYDNGTSDTLYTIPVATFVNPDSLQAIAGNAYQATYATGTVTYDTAGSSGAGTLKTSSLESSNVDIASEFTDLVQTQQIYSANAKAVSTVNSMMQTLIQLQSV
jgi:flagellar hook protein FlgE